MSAEKYTDRLTSLQDQAREMKEKQKALRQTQLVRLRRLEEGPLSRPPKPEGEAILPPPPKR